MWADLYGATNNLNTRYLRGDAIDELFARIEPGDITSWTLTDRMLSVRDVIINDGTVKNTLVYDGFGKIISETDNMWRGRYAWTGRELDVETKLQYNRARFYDSNIGRWTSQDPIGFEAGDSNLYRYALNSPANYTDPSGYQQVLPGGQIVSKWKDVVRPGAKARNKLFVYAFEGAGSKLGFSMDPVNTVVRQAVKTGASNKFDLNYRYYSWADGPRAVAERFRDWVTSDPCDKFVVIGYSWGGNAALLFVNNSVFVTWDLIFTIDPVNVVPGLPKFIPQFGNNANVGVNHYQQVDRESIKGPGGFVRIAIRGVRINGFNNSEFKAGDFAKKEFHLKWVPVPKTKFFTLKATNYPNGGLINGNAKIAHIMIPYHKRVLDDLRNRIAKL